MKTKVRSKPRKTFGLSLNKTLYFHLLNQIRRETRISSYLSLKIKIRATILKTKLHILLIAPLSVSASRPTTNPSWKLPCSWTGCAWSLSPWCGCPSCTAWPPPRPPSTRPSATSARSAPSSGSGGSRPAAA